MKSWIKGGLWGIGVSLILSVASLIILGLLTGTPLLQSLLLPYILPAILLILLRISECNIVNDSCTGTLIIGTLLSLLIYFGIGALVGCLIGRRGKK
jgi:hypothetical protein